MPTIGQAVGIEGHGAVHAREVLGALLVGDVDGDDVALDDATVVLDVLIGHLIGEQLLDLEVNLGIGGLCGRHLDGNLVVGVEINLGSNGDSDGDDVVLVLGDEGGILAEVRTLDRHDVQLVEHDGLGGIEKVVGGVSQNGLAADDAVDHGTRSTTTTEALELIAAGDVLVCLRDIAVDVCGGHGNGSDNLVVLGPLGGDGDIQRSSW